MKTTNETSTAFDRVSTHEELHQVLALLTESTPRLVAETQGESDEDEALRDAVCSLWQDVDDSGEEADPRGEFRWAGLVSPKPERLN